VSVEQRTQVPKAYAFIGAVTLLSLLHFINALAAPVSNLIGWGLPAFLSFKALESPGTEDDAQWLAYWVIFGFFNFAEGFALRAFLYYFPWYFSFRTLFILWLQLPAFRVSIPLFSRSSRLIIFLPVPGRANDLLHGAEACLRKFLSPQRWRVFPVPFQRHRHGGGSAWSRSHSDIGISYMTDLRVFAKIEPV